MNIEFSKKLQKIEEAINSFFPENRENISDELIKKSFGEPVLNISNNLFQDLFYPPYELIKRGGKRWRALLTALSCEFAGGELLKVYELTPLIELCHTASLIHDDIEDNSDERRGAASIHVKYGLDKAVNIGSWLYFHAGAVIDNALFDSSVKEALYHVYIRNLRRLHLGQALDINWHSRSDYTPKRNEYIEMIRLKTGSLARLAGEVGFIAAGKDLAEASVYGQLLTQVGAGFQIIDDVKNITAGIKGKKYGDDIAENKKSFPVILHIEKNPLDAPRIYACFKRAAEEGVNSPAVAECISIILSSDAVREAESYAFGIIESSLEKIRNMYPDRNMDSIEELFKTILK